MTFAPHPAAVLYQGARPFPALAACEHFAGSEKNILKALQLQSELLVEERPIFDITADCEDGAPAGHETQHAAMTADYAEETGAIVTKREDAGKVDCQRGGGG